jgi:tetratricopeptide (TPR) repeat protein
MNTPDLQVQDGLLKARDGDLLGARKSFESALAMNPANVYALEALYQSYASKGAEAEGRQKISQYVARVPASAEAQQFLGHLQLGSNHPDLARKAFNAAKAADPHFMKADFSLVQIDVAERKLDDAEARLQSILSQGGNGSVAHLWLGIIEQARGHRDPAIEHFHKSLELDSSNPETLNNLAYLLADYKNQADEALKYAQKARELAPDNADYGDTLGWILYKKGLYTMAVKELAGADAIKKRDPLVKYHLAMAYARAGNEGSGRETLAAALKLNSSLPEAKMATDLIGPIAK